MSFLIYDNKSKMRYNHFWCEWDDPKKYNVNIIINIAIINIKEYF
jgi:hypothetical protein